MVPNGWKICTIDEVAEVKGGKRLPKGFSLVSENTGYPYIRIADINSKGINLDNIKYIPENAAKKISRYTISKDDIFITVAGTIGLVGEVPAELDGANLTENADKLTDIKINKKYLMEVLNSSLIKNKIEASKTQNAQPKLAIERIKKFTLLSPPVAEQKKIARILSTWDKAIIITEQLLANSQQQKKVLMQQLLTGKKRLLDENRVRFSNAWEKGNLSDLGNITKGKALSTKDIVNGDYPVIAGGKKSPYTHNNFTHEDIITVSASGAYAGYVSYHPYKLWASDCSVISPKSNSDIIFIFHTATYLQERIYSLQSGGAQPHIYPKDLKALKINIPTLKEQQKIAAVLSSADKEITVLQQKLDMLKQEKKALMQQLLTGKRRVKVEEAA